jgi:polyhydroxybutyrate depolymerase
LNQHLLNCCLPARASYGGLMMGRDYNEVALFRENTTLTAALLFLSTAIPCFAADRNPAVRTGDYKGKLNIGSRERYYTVHVPRKLPEKPAVVIVLHGALSGAWTVGFNSDMSRYADKQRFIAVYPSGTGYGKRQLLFWNAGGCCGPAYENDVDDVAFIRELIALMKSNYGADSSRVYIAGASNGGMMAYRTATELSDQIAAIAAVDSCMFPQAKAPSEPVSVIAINGTGDTVIPYKGGVGRWFIYDVKDVPAAKDTIAYWVAQNHCCAVPERDESNGVLREHFKNGTGGSAVTLVTIKGGQHVWPGGRCSSWSGDLTAGKVKATEEILKFFWQHPKTAPGP